MKNSAIIREEKRREEKRREEKRREEKRREEHIDLLRIIACLMVIFNHTNERGFYRYVTDVPGSLSGILNLIPSIACKAAVPIFFIISGALLLRRRETIGRTYRRVLKVAADLLVFSILYFAVDSYLSGSEFRIAEICLRIIQGDYWHLWYLYAYIVLILTLPVLRDFVGNLKSETCIVLYTIAVIFMGIIPVFEYFVFEINALLKPSWLTSAILIYPILGYMIDNRIDMRKVSGANIGAMWLVNAVCFAISECAEYALLCKEPYNATEMFIGSFCIVNAPLIFLTVKWLCCRITFGSHLSWVISETGKCTFGIYLMHILFLWKIKPLFNFWLCFFEQGEIGSKIGIFATCVAVFLLSGIITYCVRKIPIIKYLM